MPEPVTFTDEERRYLHGHRLGRIATTSGSGEPDVAAVTFTIEGHTIEVGGRHLATTLKYHNVRATGRAAFVVDDLWSVDPWRPRGVKIHGQAELVESSAGGTVIRITPDTVWSWGLERYDHFPPASDKRPSSPTTEPPD